MRALLFLVTLLSWTTTSRGANVLLPYDVGIPNDSGGEVFTIPNTVAPSARAQQVFGASDFTNLGTPRLLISDIGFGVGSEFLFETRFLENIGIWFSTTTGSPDHLSTTYAQNVGLDELQVYSGPLAFGAGPSTAYGIRLHLQTPFLYDPSVGNLLLDIRNFRTAPPPRFPPNAPVLAWNIMGDATSTVYGYDVNSPTASFSTTKGLSTVLTYTPVPEPSSALLLFAGLAVLPFVRLKTAKRGSPGMTKG